MIWPPVGKSGALMYRRSCADDISRSASIILTSAVHTSLEVVRRDVRRHADRDAGGAVDQQIRNARRQHHRLVARAVVIGAERDRVLLDLGQHLVADARQPALGVAHRRGVVAVERSEVARAVDERIPQREGLRHAHERLVERGVAVRMVVAHHVADHLRALAVLGVGGQVLLPHRVQDAALHRLQAVADVRQRARGDDRERVVEVPLLRRRMERDMLVSSGLAAGRQPRRRSRDDRRSEGVFVDFFFGTLRRFVRFTGSWFPGSGSGFTVGTFHHEPEPGTVNH